MTEHVAKVIEVVGTSDESIEAAIHAAVARSARTVRDMRWLEVTQLRAQITDQKVDRFQVMMKIGFSIDDE